MRVAIVGSRPNYDEGSRTYDRQTQIRHLAVQSFVSQLPAGTIVVSGGAPGVDSVAVNTAALLGLQTEVFRADWETHGKKAGYMRNHQIVQASDWVAAFWDGESKGTKHTIDIATAAGKKVEVYR